MITEREIGLLEVIGTTLKEVLNERDNALTEMLNTQATQIKKLQEDVNSLLDLLAEK
ncbi:hypothetical protein [Arsenophonus nasoniae]|uniref:Uncharacterized protein n=1 Tax=Arsenophonus nasoniae TaxID=638 RepID=A0AA95GK78_9GAMM|nr:hypothetical protein [Arsenophonus nasoniae]WGL93757.1 hypothetical protein QE207_00400 [Arsenophonus nasoniae]WGL95801.1 hypothetical protein QE207_04125 [Arsenophonus nasoniae]WGL96031.1 hypothetical protein QE207_05445 [Arsenophonus nasoniae]